jgi:hypothetical protein
MRNIRQAFCSVLESIKPDISWSESAAVHQGIGFAVVDVNQRTYFRGRGVKAQAPWKRVGFQANHLHVGNRVGWMMMNRDFQRVLLEAMIW